MTQAKFQFGCKESRLKQLRGKGTFLPTDFEH